MKKLKSDLFELLHDDIVICILCKLSSSASSPSDFISVLLTCKRLNKLGVHQLVLSKTCSKALTMRAKNWCVQAHRFLKLCFKAGNIEAYYILGMIRFYCLQNRGSGASLMAKAAAKSHAQALYSLALIQFNGSGSLKNDKDLRAGFSLCTRAAFLGHTDALRELGHCFQDGYGVPKNISEGHRLLVQANAREAVSFLPVLKNKMLKNNLFKDSDYENGNDNKKMHPVNKFMVEWFGLKRDWLKDVGLRMCSYKACGRPETRRNEFRRCSGCGKVNYCSRGCQARDWRVNHKVECVPMEVWMGRGIGGVEEGYNMDGEEGYNMDGEDFGVGDRTVEIGGGEVVGIRM